MNTEEIDVCRNLEESASRAMRSKRMLRILSNLQDSGMIEYDPFGATAKLTEAGAAALEGARV
jgi:hypothetical protein